MLKIILSSCIVAAGALLVGCDSGESKGKDDVVASSQAKSDTAIYLRSGVGIDFGIKPFKDILGVESGNDYRRVTYLFEQSPEEIDKAIKPILEEAGYVRSIKETKGLLLHVWYEKKSAKKDFVNFRYYEHVSEGFTKKNGLHVSWYIDK
ncbi:MAG TPA: hypothetical protein PK873_09700 [Pseudomonas sp.]|uniref:hypothetical protein n=1 Tax=Pseudomonas sp. TaxID=306 RepID=UPI002BAC3B83|nr:hypothetical protein [Pseudomonas sp.]HRL93826.1 hypothetical protein [Pseudomonas sp.]